MVGMVVLRKKSYACYGGLNKHQMVLSTKYEQGVESLLKSNQNSEVLTLGSGVTDPSEMPVLWEAFP